MYIICFNRGLGSDVYFYGRKHGDIHFTGCKIVCKHYKTFNKAHKTMLELVYDTGYPFEWFSLYFIPVDTCKEWGLIR